MRTKLLALVRSLRDKAFRDAFVETEIESIIPFQIRAMRKRHGWSQQQLAEKAGMTQARISVLESPSYEGAVNVKTLVKLASAFDVGLIVRFAPFGEIADWSSRLSRESHEVPTYQMELDALEATESEEVSIAQSVALMTRVKSNVIDAANRFGPKSNVIAA